MAKLTDKERVVLDSLTPGKVFSAHGHTPCGERARWVPRTIQGIEHEIIDRRDHDGEVFLRMRREPDGSVYFVFTDPCHVSQRVRVLRKEDVASDA